MKRARFHYRSCSSHSSDSHHVLCSRYSPLQISTRSHTTDTCVALRAAHSQAPLNMCKASFLKTLRSLFCQKTELQFFQIILAASCTAVRLVSADFSAVHRTTAPARVQARLTDLSGRCNYLRSLLQATEKGPSSSYSHPRTVLL